MIVSKPPILLPGDTVEEIDLTRLYTSPLAAAHGQEIVFTFRVKQY